MDIFSAVNKQSAQTNSAQSIKSEAPQATKQVEQIERAKTDVAVDKTAKAQDQKSKEEIKEHLNNAVKKMNMQMDALNTNIMFGYNDKIEAMFVNVMERDSGKLIRKIPSEEAMKLAEKMAEIVGMIFDQKG